jgi:hypothetical protein
MIWRLAPVVLVSVLSVQMVDASSIGRTADVFGASPLDSALHSISVQSTILSIAGSARS